MYLLTDLLFNRNRIKLYLKLCIEQFSIADNAIIIQKNKTQLERSHVHFQFSKISHHFWTNAFVLFDIEKMFSIRTIENNIKSYDGTIQNHQYKHIWSSMAQSLFFFFSSAFLSIIISICKQQFIPKNSYSLRWFLCI